MVTNSELNTLTGDTLEIHYWFLDNSHSMDAVIQNKCEYEILGIIKEVSQILSIEIVIETEPLAEGGLKRWFRIAFRDENRKATITVGVILGLITAVLIKPLESISEKLVDKLFEDKHLIALEKEDKELEIEKKKLEIANLKQEISQKQAEIEDSLKIKKKKSNFYEALEKYDRIDKVSFIIVDRNKKETNKEETVSKSDFKGFILISDNLEPITVDEAIIEIISPVLKKEGYKWTGYYNGEPISFNMKSNEFKALVQGGKVEFRNGSSINCLLQINRKINNEGAEYIIGYDVIRVNSYFENDKPIETKEGKKYRQIQEGKKNQLGLFNDEEMLNSGN